MNQYDIAVKVLIERCRDEIIRRFLGIEVKESSMVVELPQETVSLKRSDYPVLVTDSKGVTALVIIEFQTYWNKNVPLNLLDYRTRYLLKYEFECISCVILLRPSGIATEIYSDKEVTFKYSLIKIYELNAGEVINSNILCLMPFVPLMCYGRDFLFEADNLIYKSSFSRAIKADMLTSMAILSGLISKDMPLELIKRRKDIMIESAAYNIIKQDGILEGKKEGIYQGLYDAIKSMLKAKFGDNGIRMNESVKKIRSVKKLKALIEIISKADTLEEVRKYLKTFH